jgi:hypothetical protein
VESENDYYTWAEYVAEVKKLLPIEANRVGIGSTATDYLTSLIRQGVIDLQRAIPGFRINHETIYYPDDLVREGLSCRGVKPPQSTFKSLSIFRVSDDKLKERAYGTPYPWERRFDLVHGGVAVNDGQCRYSIDPAGYTFCVYPMDETQCWLVSMFWDGQKLDFQDDEQVPFTEASALAVSYFVKANTSLEVEDGVPNSERYAGMFREQATKLFIDDKRKRG